MRDIISIVVLYFHSVYDILYPFQPVRYFNFHNVYVVPYINLALLNIIMYTTIKNY